MPPPPWLQRDATRQSRCGFVLQPLHKSIHKFLQKNAKNNSIHSFLKNKNAKNIHMKLHGLTASEYKWLFWNILLLLFTTKTQLAALQQQLHNLHQNDRERDIERNWRQMKRTGCCAVAIYNQQLTVEIVAGWKSPNCCLIANSTTATPCKYTTLTELKKKVSARSRNFACNTKQHKFDKN